MAYGVKYHIGWRGDRRERLEYDILILKRDYTGSVTEAYLMDDGMVLTYGKQDDDELVPFKPSTASLSLFCNDESVDYSDLYTSDPLEYQVTITEVRNFLGVLRWRGYISTGRYSRPWGRTPFKVTIEANDGMEALMNIPYQVDSTTRHADTLTIRNLIERLVAPLGVTDVNISSIPKISPSQTEDSADVIGVAANAIYEAFDNEVPSHYDLLIAVLQHFGLQAYFEGDKLCVRSVLGLASLSRPDWAGSLESSFGQTPLTYVPLESTMSVEAELSMLPPVKCMSTESKGTDGRLLSMLDPQRWGASATKSSSGISGFAKAYRGGEGLILIAETAREEYPYTAAGVLKYTFDGWLIKSTSSAIALSCELFDRVSSMRTDAETMTPVMSAVFILVAESEYSEDIIQPDGSLLITIPANSYVWDERGQHTPGATPKTWVKVSSNGWFIAASLFRYGFRVAINAQDVSAQQARRLPTKLLKSTQASFELSGIPGENGERYRLVMLVGSATKSENFYVEMLTPTILISQGDIGTPDDESSNISVHSNGSGEVLYKQGINSSYTSQIFCPSIIDIKTGEAAYRYVSPAISSQMFRVLGSKLRDMRSAVTRQLEGEVAVARPLSLNTLWRDESGSVYYTNYIRMMLKRGVSEVQLRELTPLRANRIWEVGDLMNARYAANDSTAVLVGGAYPGAILLDPHNRAIVPLGDAIDVSKGVDSMCVVRLNIADSSDYTICAYGNGGKILSTIDSLLSVVRGAGATTVSRQLANAARYDATTGMWVIPNISGNVCKVYLADTTGSVVSTYSITGEGTLKRIVVISGGFVAVDYISAEDIRTTSYYYNILGEVESYIGISNQSEELIDVNDVYAIVQNATEVIIRETGSLRTELLKGSVLRSFNRDAISYVDMNCSLVLFRNSLGEGVVYDGRTGNRVVISDNTLGTAQRHMLIGECVYTPSSESEVLESRILEGMSTSAADEPFEILEGAFILADGSIFNVKSL